MKEVEKLETLKHLTSAAKSLCEMTKHLNGQHDQSEHGHGGGGGGAAGTAKPSKAEEYKKETGLDLPPRNAEEKWKKSYGFKNAAPGDIAYMDQGTKDAYKLHIMKIHEDVKNGTPGVSGVVLDDLNKPIRDISDSSRFEMKWAYDDQVGAVYKKPKK